MERIPKGKPASTQATLARLARDGVVTIAQARQAGLSNDDVSGAVNRGFLIRDAPGVFRLVGAKREGRTAMRAALAATRADGVALYSSVALHGVNSGVVPQKVHVMVGRNSHLVETDWYVPHRTRRLEPHDVTSRNGIPAIALARTIRDFAAHLPADRRSDEQLSRWVEEALILKQMTLRNLEQAARDERSLHVARRLSRLLDYHHGVDPQVFKSKGEEWLRDLVKRLGLPMPLFNAVVPGTTKEVDAYYPDVPLIIEFDGFVVHRNRSRHDRDRRRDRRGLRDATPTVRITSTDFDEHRAELESDIEFLVTHRMRFEQRLGARRV